MSLSITSQVVKTYNLKFQYVHMPAVDLNYRFLYRFEEPVQTVWMEELIPPNLTGPAIDMQQELKCFAQRKWRDIVHSNISEKGTGDYEVVTVPHKDEWLSHLTNVQLIEYEIAPKAT